jgi:hypothetical protein
LGTFATGGERPLAVGLKETPPEGMAGGVLSRQILRGLGDRDLPSTHAVNSLRRYFVPLGAQMMSGSGGAECEFHRSACWCRDPVFPSALPRSRLSEMEPAYPAALSEPGAWSAPAADTPRLRGPRSRGQFKLDLRLDPCPLPAHDGQSALVGAEDSAGDRGAGWSCRDDWPTVAVAVTRAGGRLAPHATLTGTSIRCRRWPDECG